MLNIKLSYNKDNKIKSQEFAPVPADIAEILLNRGFQTVEEMESFLKRDPGVVTGEMKDLPKAAQLISEAITEKRQIVLYSDTDADGCMSAVVGMRLLRKLGANASYYTNNRFDDGYGLCRNGIDQILEKWPDVSLIVTADNGIAAMDIAYAKEKGLTVVVTDHHEPLEQLPPADALVDPKQVDCPYSFKDLCGAGVLYKVMQKVFELQGRKVKETSEVVPYVAVATIGDIVPMLGPNRFLAYQGLKMINEKNILAFDLLKERLELCRFDSHSSIAYVLVPMINAMSRIEGNVIPAIELFLSDDPDEIRGHIELLKQTNETRKELTKEHVALAETLVPDPLDQVLVLQDDSFSEGIVGILAGKLKEEYNRPVFVFSGADSEGICKGSARSIAGFHLKETLEMLQGKHELFVGFGGHEKAAGLSIPQKNIQRFKELVNEVAVEKGGFDDLEKEVVLDLSLSNTELDVERVERIYDALGPFGEGFPEPMIGLSYKHTHIYYMGTEKQHVKCFDSLNQVSVIDWYGADRFNQIRKIKGKAVGRLDVNEYNGKKSVQLIVQDSQLF